MKLAAGTVVGPYRVISLIGEGGMAAVYKAHHAALNRFVALKVLPSQLANDPDFRVRFRDEARRVASLRHANIPTVFDYGETEDAVIYMASEFVDGGTLEKELGQPLPPEYMAAILGPVASALDYAHSQGLIHRDMKPTNVLIGSNGTPYLTDFGVARMMASDLHLTQAGMVVGTPQYMAPEQGSGEAVEASDNYSLAVIAYQMLTGRVPFDAPTPVAVLLAHQADPLPLPRSVNPLLSEATEQVLLKGLARQPGDRFASASEFVTTLTSASGDSADLATKLLPSFGGAAALPASSGREDHSTTVSSTTVAAAERARDKHRSRLILAGAGLLSVLILAVGTFGLLRSSTRLGDTTARTSPPISPLHVSSFTVGIDSSRGLGHGCDISNPLPLGGPNPYYAFSCHFKFVVTLNRAIAAGEQIPLTIAWKAVSTYYCPGHSAGGTYDSYIKGNLNTVGQTTFTDIKAFDTSPTTGTGEFVGQITAEMSSPKVLSAAPSSFSYDGSTC